MMDHHDSADWKASKPAERIVRQPRRRPPIIMVPRPFLATRKYSLLRCKKGAQALCSKACECPGKKSPPAYEISSLVPSVDDPNAAAARKKKK